MTDNNNMTNTMIDSKLSLEHAKVNFELATFAYPVTFNLDPSVVTRKQPP
jgi:hypothetical protein